VAGALTPTEVYTAWSAGAAMVKVFPCRALGGSRYIADLLGPFDKVSLMAVGGVNLSNLEEYFRAGADAVGVGGSLFGLEALRERDPARVGRNVRRFLEQCTDLGQKRGLNQNHSKGVEDVPAGNQGH
jgi:2-dehydro-3-deoxyphosphogluconate aldolase/(4S)-4-hydroxy-2-oxoglutarate aldolase